MGTSQLLRHIRRRRTESGATARSARKTMNMRTGKDREKVPTDSRMRTLRDTVGKGAVAVRTLAAGKPGCCAPQLSAQRQHTKRNAASTSARRPNVNTTKVVSQRNPAIMYRL